MTDLVKALADASQVLYREAYYLDAQRWDEWLAMFTDDCEYWMPAWKGEHELTDNPKREISLIYYGTRAGLEDRVWRIRSGQSIASTPVPRTTHAVNNVLVEDVTADSMTALSTWTAHCFFHKTNKSEVFYGDYRHTLRRIDTPVNPAREVFVDYVVLGGRLLIRRIFDSATPPDHAFTLDPALAAVDWSDPQACHGTTIYRKLEEGRWVISVTGNGALGLSRVQGAEPTALVESPTVRDFTEELRKIDTKIAELGLDDVWERISK